MFRVLFASLLLALSAHAEFRAGAAAEDVTPTEWPLAMRGSFRPQLTESAHDPLHSRAVVFDDGKTRIAIAVVDSCMVGRDVLDRAKEIAAEKTGIPTERILISATHTHSAPFANASNGTPEELAYQKLLTAGIAESIVKAAAALQPAEFGSSGQDLPDEVFNRRWFLKAGTMPMNPFGSHKDLVKMNPGSGPHLINPAGPTDPEVATFSVRDLKHRPLALIANYSLHYVGTIPDNQVSADYFGEFSRLIGVRLRRPVDSGFVGILSNGTSGDVNNINFGERRPPREPFEQVRQVATKVADSAFRAYASIDHRSDVTLGMVERKITLKLRSPTTKDIERSKRYLAAEDEKSVPPLGKHYARSILKHVKLGKATEIKIQAVRIGDLAICTFPFEVFAEIGLDIKAKSPFADTFVIELANGAMGYLPTEEQHALGGYETWLTTSKAQKDADKIITKNLVEMMAELASNK
ncbi:MAG: neutral ceramidase [Verrucomicrobiales bacterium]|jgi:neutral ceramidase